MAIIVVVPTATPTIALFTTLAIAESVIEYFHLPVELETGFVIAARVWPTSTFTGASVPIVGVVPRIVTLKVVEPDNQKSLAACVIVITALPAFPKLSFWPLILTTAGSDDVYVQAPADVEVGGRIVCAASPTTFCKSSSAK